MVTTEERDTITDQFVSYKEVRAALGNCPQRTLDDRILALGVTVYTNPMDRRRRLIHAADLARLITPYPTPRRRTANHV